MTADEIWDNLLLEVMRTVYAVENALELMELPERRLTHEFEHSIARMFGSNLEPAAHMMLYKFLGVPMLLGYSQQTYLESTYSSP